MSMRRLADGRYRLRYHFNGTKTGKRAQETLPANLSAKEAKRIYLERLSAASMRHGTTARRITFSELAAEYLAEHGPIMAPNSLERASAALKLHILPVFGHMLVESIKAHQIARWQRERLSARAKPASVNREWTVMKAILNFGEAKELIERNPIRRGAVRLLKAHNMRTGFFEPDEWRAFITAFDDPDRWKAHLTLVRSLGKARQTVEGSPLGSGSRRPDSEATKAYLNRLRAAVPIFRALLYTGSRLGEILSLTWGNVDLKRDLVTIYQHKTKNAKSLPISSAFRSLLLSLLPGVGNALVFRKPDGSAFGPMEIQRAFDVALRLARLREDVSVHSIRHTVGSWLTIAGHPERHVAEILGHSLQNVTRRYAHLSRGSLRPVVEDIARIECEGFRDPKATSGHDHGSNAELGAKSLGTANQA
jgi:integrase